MQASGSHQIDLAVHIGSDVTAVREALEPQGVTVIPQAFKVAGPVGLLYFLQAVLPVAPSAYPGSVIQPVVIGNSVVGFRLDPSAEIVALAHRVLQLERAAPIVERRQPADGPNSEQL